MTLRQRFAPLSLLLCLAAGGQKTPLSHAPSPDAPCLGSRLLANLSRGSGASLLQAYGYDLQKPWTCTRVESPWSAGAEILRFRRVTVETDDQTAFSIVQLPGLNYVWVIPTETGMLEVAHSESDPHNLAAFNAMLQLHKGPVNASGWLEAGKLYMTILGHKEAVPIKAESGDSDSCATSGECSVSFSDRQIVPGTAYNRWTLNFTVPSKNQPVSLIEAVKETVHPDK